MNQHSIRGRAPAGFEPLSRHRRRLGKEAQKRLALDLGAESGRAILGRLDGEHLILNEVHRFSNHPVYVGDRYYWNPLSLFTEMKNGLKIAETSYNIRLDAVGIDTWGVDFALLDKNDSLLDNPRNYRDPRTNGFPEKAFEEVSQSDIFAQTGIQFLNIKSTRRHT